MKTFVAAGEHLSLTAPAGGVTSGQGVLIGALFGVAEGTAAAGAAVTVATRGVDELPKAGASTFDQGARVSWDPAAGICTPPGAGKAPIGAAVQAAGAGAAVVRVRLDGTATAAA